MRPGAGAVSGVAMPLEWGAVELSQIFKEKTWVLSWALAADAPPHAVASRKATNRFIGCSWFKLRY